MKPTEENIKPDTARTEVKLRSISFYVILGVMLYALIKLFTLLSPILLSFLLVLLISLAVNQVYRRCGFVVPSWGNHAAAVNSDEVGRVLL